MRMSAHSGGAYASDTFCRLLGPDPAREAEAYRIADQVLAQQSPHWLDLYAVAACAMLPAKVLHRLLEKIPPAACSKVSGYWSVYLALANNKVTSPETLYLLLTLPVEPSLENKTIPDRYKEVRDLVRRRLGIKG